MKNTNQTISTEENINKELFKWLFEKDNIELCFEEDHKPRNDIHSKFPNIYYTPELKAFFETYPMLRLKRILQLSQFIDNNSNVLHTRYEHSLGVYNLKKNIILKQFLYDSDFRNYVEQNGLKYHLIAELIKSAGHDIGHLPLSHTLELSVIGKPGFHEEIGKRILLEYKDIQNVLINISPDMPKILEDVLNNDYFGFKLLDEGNYDIDRFDYLPRDLAYEGYHQSMSFKPFRLVAVDTETKNGVASLKKNPDNSIIVHEKSSNKPTTFIPVFDISSIFDIENFLNLRVTAYKESYFHPVTQIRDKAISTIINRAIEEKEPNGKNLQNFLSILKNTKNSDDIDIDDWLKWDDLSLYNELLDIAEFSNDKSLRDATSFAIPSLDQLLDISAKMLGLKNHSQPLTNEDKQFLKRLRNYISNKSELTEKLTDFNYWDKCIKFTCKPETIKKLKTDSSLPIQFYSHKVTGYNPKSPLYFKNFDGKIFAYDDIPNRPKKVSSSPVIIDVAFCLLPFVDETAFDKPDLKLLDGINNFTFGNPYLNRPSPSAIYVKNSLDER